MYGRSSMFLSLFALHEGILLGQIDACRFLGELVALADVCTVCLEWYLFGADRAEPLVLVACLGAQVEQVRDVLDLYVVR